LITALFRFVMLIHSEGIRAQSRTLSEITVNFGRYLPSQNLLGHPLQNYCTRYHPGDELHPVVRFCEFTPSSPKVIGVNMLNFEPNFKFSPLKFCGDPSPIFGVH